MALGTSLSLVIVLSFPSHQLRLTPYDSLPFVLLSPLSSQEKRTILFSQLQLFERFPLWRGVGRDAEDWIYNTQTLKSQIPLVNHQDHFPRQRQLPP